MRISIASIALMAAVTCSSATAQERSVTISCLDAPKLCKCDAFPLACLGSTAQLSRVGNGRVQVISETAFGRPIQTVRCVDLSYENCKKAGCTTCRDQ